MLPDYPTLSNHLSKTLMHGGKDSDGAGPDCCFIGTASNIVSAKA